LNKVLHTIRTDLPTVSRYTEIKYEDLIAEPVEMLIKIYQTIGLEYSADFDRIVKDYLKVNCEFEKNIFTLSREEKDVIATTLKEHMDYYGYFS
jgi:hypothetical protein